MAHKEANFLWSIIHKVVAMNRWHGRILTKIDKNCLHCDPQFVVLVVHRFFSCPLAPKCGAMHLTSFGNFLPKR